MIPYFELTQIHLGPVTLQVWGTMVALGILFGAMVSARYAVRFQTSKDVIYAGAFWIIVAAFIGARLFHMFAYQPSYYWANPAEIIKIWHGGFSMMGGLLGAALGYTAWIYKRGLNWIAMADQFVYGLPLGIGCGRIGCFLVHDHPGTLTHFVLGVRYPDGTRHDHGLYLSINGFILALVFYVLSRKSRPAGFFLRAYMIWDGATRFALDFYRVNDATYAGLTPAQYASLLMCVAGIIWSVRERSRRRALLVAAS